MQNLGVLYLHANLQVFPFLYETYEGLGRYRRAEEKPLHLGTGYSSLSYLKRFPIDSLKIDRSFIRDLTTNADDAAITRAIIAMAHSLKLRVVAEGVEEEKQIEFLREEGCDEMQGFFFSPPVPAEAFIGLIQEGKHLQVGMKVL